MNKYLKNIGINANKAFKKKIDTKIKNRVLDKYAYLINKNKFKIINQNKKDVNYAKKKGLKETLIKRLNLDLKKIDQITKSIKIISKIKDPINITLSKWKRPNGLKIKKVSIPLGVIGII